MARRIDIEPLTTLAEHARHVHLASAVDALRSEAAVLERHLRGRTVWMINSTAQGGGVSEMLPGMIGHLRELGIDTEWLVIDAQDERFFQLTKRLHNMIHGDGPPDLSADDRDLFERVNRRNADVVRRHVRRGDVVVVHDPQPMPIAGMLRESIEITTVWRCHIGLDSSNAATDAAWRFLAPYGADYHHGVFSAPDYVPPWFEDRSSIIHPALDPLTAKNRPLNVQSVVRVLSRAALLRLPEPRIAPPFDAVARRWQGDGTWQSADRPDDLGLLTRPIITQVSRWDRLKGFLPLIQGFVEFRRRLAGDANAADGAASTGNPDSGLLRRLQRSRLVLAGPDPDSIADDPEGREVLDELCAAYLACDPDVRADIALLALPMHDATVNALIVNALQRVSTVCVQNSLREGFGLTITEAMWKGVPVLSSARACGPRQQVRDRVDGVLVDNPEDRVEVAQVLHEMLSSDRLEEWGRNAQQRVHGHFLIHAQLTHWVRLLETLTGAAKAA